MELFEKNSPVIFESVDGDEIHELALSRARRYLVAEADLLEVTVFLFRVFQLFRYP